MDNDPIRICTIVPVQPVQPEEEPSNGILARIWEFIKRPFEPAKHYLAVSRNLKWEPGQTLRVRFLGGSFLVKNMVKKYALVWLEHANLKMEFVESGDADIRISFWRGDSWSVIGLEAYEVPPDKPTMNFGWFNDYTPEEEFSRTVLHEFGHALGCIHEHQNPAENINWNEKEVFDHYKKAQPTWDEDQVRRNIFKQYSRDSTQFSSYDKDSIMVYEIPVSFTLDGHCTKSNKQLSEQDKLFMSKVYPRLEFEDENCASNDDLMPQAG
ncbi:hypothetical protein PT974_02104 [Cladobotryum mycophilum]|uniref:Peptidase metallopeptidase domain-containing protein n=1 Tax=Cladobotryum mycophilum TaxID=491253 RepID=A0ABR0SX80_9HYPO